MAEVTNTNNIIQQYIKSHPELTNKTQEQILSIMIKNGVITPTEAQKISAFAKTSSVHNTDMPGLHFEKNKTNQAKTNYDIDFSYEEAQDFAIENISQNVQDAFAVFYAQDNGIITKGYDSIKEFFDGELSSKNVGDVLRNEQKSVEYLTKAKEGTLSKKQYYIENKERLKEMMLKRVYERDESTGDSFIDRMRGDLSKNEFAKLIETTIDARLDSLTNLGAEKSIKAIKGLQHQLVTMDDKALEEFLNELNKTAREQKIKSHNIEGQPSIKQPEIPIEFTSEEPMTFEEVYKLERGTNFNEALMENLAKNKGEINFAIGAFNKYNQFKTEADRLLDEYSEATKVYTDENNISTAGHEPNADLRADDVLNLYKSYYENSPDPDAAKKNLENIINKTNLPVQLKNEGNGDFTLDLSALGDNYRQNKVLNTILKMGIQEEKNKLDKLLGGKTIEEFAKNYETSYKATLGSENANELAKAMEADNMTAIQRYTGNTAMSGMGLMVIGGVLTVTPAAPLGGVLLAAGQVTALTGIAAKNMLGFTDALTRDEINEEEIKELSKNLAMDIGGFVIGGAAGRKGLEVGKALAEKGYSTLTSMVAEHGTDFTLSLAGDLAMMGALNSSDTAEGLTEGNFIGVLVSTVTGIRTSKYLYNTNKIETKTETYLDPVTKKAIEATYILNPKTNKYELAKNQYSRREIQTNIESIKYRNIDGRSNLIYLAEDTDIAKYGINTLEDLRKSNLITTEEKEVIGNLYKHAEQLGYKDLYDKNLNVLAGFASTAEKVNGKLVTKFDNLDKNQFEVIKYITDQLHNGSIKGEYLSAIVSRIQDPIPYEVFKYADNPETLPDEIRRGDISWSKEQCQEWIKEIKTMEKFLNTQSIPADIKVQRVDDYSVMNNIHINGKPLGQLMEEAVNTGKIEELIARLNNFQNIEVKFDNFIGTTMPSQQPFSSHRNIIWEIDVPKGTHGAFLESAATSNTIYAEAEFLIQKDSTLKINGVEFKDGSWHIKAEVVDKRQQLKQKISTGEKIHNRNLKMSKGKLASPNEKFAETPEAFSSIITTRADNIKNLMQIKDDKIFYEKLYTIFKEEMGINEIAPEISFEKFHENARAGYYCTDNKLRIFENNFPKNRAEGAALIAHELKHFLQFKEELLTEDIGLDGVIEAMAKNITDKNPNISQEQAINKVTSWFVNKDGNFNEHILKIYDYEGYGINEAIDTFGLKAHEYNQNEANYIDKTESLNIDGTLRAYENQVMEKEAYDVSDKVGTEFNKVILGLNKPMNTREYAILDAEIKNAVSAIRTRYKNKADDIKKYLFDAGLNQIGTMTARLKGSQSLYDKIANYIKEHPTASLEEALKDVRDAFGARTIVKSVDYKYHPEVKERLEAGDERGAMLKAAELQSQPAVEKLKGIILAQAQGKNGLELARISNYVSDDGIPYFSEAQLAELKQFGAQHGVNVDYVVKIDKSDPNYAQMKAAGYKPTTKGQPSGYTALQMNFKTKTGETIEWQFRGEEVNRFAEGEHIPYDLRTGKNIIGEHKELEPLYNPIKELLSKDKMDDTVYKEYNRYLSDYYKHLRKLELGFESVEPKLADYGKGFKFDERLNAENLIALHDVAENLKKGKILQKEAIEQYNKKVFENTPQKVKTLSAELLQKINDSQSIYDPTIIAVIGENLPKIQDGKILNYIKDELNSQYPNEYKILALTELENFKTGGYEALSPELKKIIQPESFYTQKNFDERLEEIKEIEDSTERTNKLSELNMMVGSKLFAISTNIRNLKSNENINYLYENYLMANVPNEYKQIMDEINEITGKKVLPQLGDIYLGKNNSDYISIPPDILKNFNKLQPQVKEIYKKYPDNFLSGEHYLSNAYIEGFNSFTPKEIVAFDKRNAIKYIDSMNMDELKHFCKMDDATFNKIQTSGLLEKINIHYDNITHKESPHLLFKDIEKITNNLSLDEIQTLKDRNIIDIKDGYFINISPEFMITLARLSDRQWDFVKNKLGLFKNNKLDLVMNKDETTGLPQIDLYERKRNAIISGIELMKNSDSRIYSKILELKNIGISPTDIMQILGNCNDNFAHYGNYAHGKVKELIQKNVPADKLADYSVPYINLQNIKGKSNINELSINEKRNLLKSLVKYNTSLFDNNFNKLLESEIIPRNKDEYCSLLPKLVKAIGIDTNPVSKTLISGYEKAMYNMSKSDSEFLTTPITKNGFKLNLEYPRDKFISDILDKVKDLPETEKMKVFDYFGFEIKIHSDGQIQMNGYPVNINNGAKLGEITNPETKAIVESVRPFVEKFTHNNKISVDGKPELTEQLNEITELFPEFKSIIGKKQHETHDFTLDVHILKVLQGVMQDPDYQKLPADDKKILNITTLLHDLTKADGRRDKTHPQQSAFDAYYLLEKMNLTEADKLKIYSLIKNHNWLEQYNNKNLTETERLDVAKNIAFELREGNNFEMASILAKADTKGVKENGAFFDRFKNVLEEASNKIANLVDNLQKTAIHLPQTKLPKASEIKVDGQNIKEEITTDSKGNTIKNKVIYLKPDMDLGALGFEKGLKSEDLNVIVHALDYDTQSAIFQALGQVDSDALLSASYVNYKKGNYHVFRQQGFILDIASTDIHAGTYKDFGSGCGKDLKTLKADYLFGGIRHDIREFMPDRLKEKLKISDEEYKKLFNEISDKSISELDITHPHVSKAMREIFEEMEIHKRKYNRNYNEWLISRPKIQGIFWEGKKGNNTYSINDVPEYLRKYAEENNLPIIYFGE